MTGPRDEGGVAGGWASWNASHLVALAVGLLAGLIVRAVLLPQPGLAGDIDEFASWVHALAIGDFGHAYDIDLTFPPVMVYVWGALAHLEPAFRTVTDASDPWIRVVMKLSPTLADLGLAAAVLFFLRSRPSWAVAAALAVWLHPAVIDVSALFAQYESIYVFFAVVAFLLAIRDRPYLAAVALGLAVMTKPQALPLLVPFGAYFLARVGWRKSVVAGVVGGVTITLLWLPFLAAGGPAGYLRSIALHQDELFGVLSLRAWNPWWILQELVGGGDFVSDQNAILGPVTLRQLGFLAAAVAELAVFVAVYRRPTPRTLALALATSALVAFTFLTTMHERYGYAAVIFLALLLPEARARWVWLAFSGVFTINLLAAVPPSVEIGRLVPIGGALGVVGSLVTLAVTAATLVLLLRPPPGEATEAPDEGKPVPVQVVG
jgi:hypothetical protein